jgi:hypothetical protein
MWTPTKLCTLFSTLFYPRERVRLIRGKTKILYKWILIPCNISWKIMAVHPVIDLIDVSQLSRWLVCTATLTARNSTYGRKFTQCAERLFSPLEVWWFKPCFHYVEALIGEIALIICYKGLTRRMEASNRKKGQRDLKLPFFVPFCIESGRSGRWCPTLEPQ